MKKIQRQFFLTPEFSVAYNAKCGSSTLSEGIMRTFYPERYQIVIQGGAEDTDFHGPCPKEIRIPSKTPVIVFRDVVSRFASATLWLGLDAPEPILDALQGNGRIKDSQGRTRDISTDRHFMRQIDAGTGMMYCFGIHQMAECLEFLNIAPPWKQLNKATTPKIQYTREQEKKILQLYAKDQWVYEETLDGPIQIRL